MAQFDKLLDTKQIQITHDLGLFHGQSSKLGGSQLSTDRLVKRRPSQEEECLCIESVLIMLDTTISLDLWHSVERSLQPCVVSASASKLM